MTNKMRIDDHIDESIKTVCITGHVSPDGDCVGSVLALYSYLSSKYKDLCIDVYLEKITSKLTFLKNSEKIDSLYQNDTQYDVMFCLDSASLSRIGKAEKFFKTANKTINIDHHISNTLFAEINHVIPDASSTCEVLFDLLDRAFIDKDIAICLYTGIVYDTGVFKYSCTSSKTMETAAKLMEYDIPITFIIDESFYAKSFNENRIYGYAILNSTLGYDGKVIYSYITRDKMAEFNVTKSDLEGIVSQLRLTRGVECSVFIYEIDDDSCKVSLRSGEYLDVNVICEKFGGGGHKRAAGCTIKGELMECMDMILKEVGKYI